MQNWEDEFDKVFCDGGYCSFKKPVVAKTRAPLDWRRCVPKATASTPGLLFLMVFRACLGRPETRRPIVAEALSRFLVGFFDGQSIELQIEPCTAATVVFGSPPDPEACEVVHIEGGRVDLSAMHEGGDVIVRSRLRAIAAHALGANGSVDETALVDLPLAPILMAAFQLKEFWLFRQLVVEIAFAVESIFGTMGFSGNPLDRPSALPRSRLDPTLLDNLALGIGSTGSEVSMFPTHHAASWVALQPPGARTRKRLDVAMRQGFILSRYAWVGRRHFENCRAISMAVDGTRIGDTELFGVALVGTAAAGATLAMWAPPQAILTQRISALVGLCIHSRGMDWRPLGL